MKRIIRKASRPLRRRAKKAIPSGPDYKIRLAVDYRELRKPGRELRAGNLLDLNGLFIIQALNKIKELDLKRRVEGGARIRVAFFVDSLAKFTAANVYWEMLREKAFEPFVVLYSLRSGSFGEEYWWNTYQEELAILQERGFKVYGGFDEKRHYIPLETFKPDLVFVSPFYLDASSSPLSGVYANVNFLVCQLNYGFNALNSYSYHYNNRQVNSAWKYFVETWEDYQELLQYSYHFGVNAVYTGSPVMDSFLEAPDPGALPQKLDFTRPTVVYAPHWTIKYHINVHDLGTFDLFHAFFLQLARENPGINFIFKPHPSLGSRLKNLKLMQTQEYERYQAEWAGLPNGAVVLDDGYINLFRHSDLLITDSASFIFEWLPVEKPCIYLRNPRKDKRDWMLGFSPQARQILKTYYLCDSETCIRKRMASLLAGDDPKKEERALLARKLFGNMGQASRRIVAYLKNIFALDGSGGMQAL